MAVDTKPTVEHLHPEGTQSRSALRPPRMNLAVVISHLAVAQILSKMTLKVTSSTLTYLSPASYDPGVKAGDTYRALGRIVRERREASDLTQADLAHAIGLGRTSVANIEAGRQSVLVHQLYGLAQALGCEPRDLLPPAARKDEITAKADLLVPRRARSSRDCSPSASRTSGSHRQMTRRIEARTERLLDDHNMAEPPIDVVGLAAALDATVVDEELDESISGMLLRDGDQAVIGVNRSHATVRQRFTVAHELGHLLLHKGTPLFVDREVRVNMRDGRSSTALSSHEIQANAFAASLLMPTHLIRSELSKLRPDAGQTEIIGVLAQRFDVSQAAMQYRLINLGILDPEDDL